MKNIKYESHIGYIMEVLFYRHMNLKVSIFPARTVNFCLHHRVQNGSGAHPDSVKAQEQLHRYIYLLHHN
jgi:hypothetical protein